MTSTGKPKEGSMSDINVSAKIAEALCKVISEVPALAKTEHNQYAGYAYVPIDTYYEKFARIAAKNGLTWVTRETAFALHDVMAAPEKRHGPQQPARPRTMAVTTYAFDVYLAGVGCLPGFGSVTVMHAVTGPQTAGSSASYAEKLFCRVALKAVTGERDGDAEEPHEVQSEPKSKEPDLPGWSAAKEPEREQRQERREETRREEPRKEEPEPQERRAEELPREEEAKPNTEIDDVIRRAKEEISGVERGKYPVFHDEVEDFGIVVEVFRVFAKTLNRSELEDFWKMNEKTLTYIKRKDLEQYNKVARVVRDRLDEIDGKRK
jgi:hypothetical protein